MNAIAAALSYATGSRIKVGTLKPVLIFSAIGLAVTLAGVLSYGLDPSPGSF